MTRRTLTLKSKRFREERQDVWKEMESMLQRIEARSVRSLTDEEIIKLPRLYRSTLSSLSVARATSLDQSVVSYLESLSTRAYYVIYGSQKRLRDRIYGFFARDWPLAVQSAWKDVAASSFVFALGMLIGFVLVSNNPDWFYSFMDESMASGRTPAASEEFLRETIYGYEKDEGGLGAFAAFLFSNNSRVSILAFALGFAFALPTIVLLLYNGLSIGAFIAVFTGKDLGFEVGGWLAIHGTTELFAIALAGAGGMLIGRAVAFPGEMSRMESLRSKAEQAAIILGGVVVMMFVAGLIEGFGRQLINNDWVRYGIGGSMLVFWLVYFFLPRKALDPHT
ncbi:MAG: stage II sporulation protein M [Litorimonas sp.]